MNLSVDIKYSTVEIMISLLMLQGGLKPRINNNNDNNNNNNNSNNNNNTIEKNNSYIREQQ